VGGNAVKEQVLEAEKIGKVSDSDKLDGLDGPAFRTRWALVNEQGQIIAQTGNFTIVSCYNANANCYINAGEDVRNNGIHAQVAVANTDGTALLSGETGTAPCGSTFVNCAPPNTEDNNVLVVAPRDSDGTPPGAGAASDPVAAGDAARFYVFVTDSESDVTP
jgi:hypothetical protein